MVAPRDGKHIGHEFGGDGCARLILLIVSCVWITWDHGGDAPRRGSLASGDEDEEFHEMVIGVSAARLKDEDVFVTNRLADCDVQLSI